MEYKDIIEKHFLSTFLSEGNDLTDKVADLTIKNEVTMDDVTDFIIELNASDINDSLKLSYLERITKIYENQLIESIDETVEVFNEYAGNSKKNKALIRLMGEMEKDLNDFYDDIMIGINAMDKIRESVHRESSKENPNIVSVAREARSIEDKIKKEWANNHISKYNATFNSLKKVCKSFGIKFNDVVMDDKKAFDKKLEAACKKATQNKKITDWMPTNPDGSTPNIVSLNKDLDELVIVNSDATRAIVSYIQPIYNYTYQSAMCYVGNINYLRKILGLEREDTIFYKVINKLLKSKKK